MQDKKSIFKFIFNNKHLIPNAIELVQEAQKIIEKANELKKEADYNHQKNIISGLFSKKDKYKEEENEILYIDKKKEDLDCVVKVKNNVLEKFNVLKIQDIKSLEEFKEKTKENKIILFSNNFEYIKGNLTSNYMSKIEIENFLGNKKILFNTNAIILENIEKNKIILYMDVNIKNTKTNEILFNAQEQIDIKNINFNSEQKIPSKIDLLISYDDNINLTLNVK